MQGEQPLFRPEVLQARQQQWLGRIVLIRPVSFRVLTLFAIACMVAFALFMLLGQYTKRARASGLLMPTAGLIRIQPPQAGIVLERRVKEGQAVRAGDVLFVMSSELAFVHDGADAKGINSNAEILSNLDSRKKSLQEERDDSTDVSVKQADVLRRGIDSLRLELQDLDKETTLQSTRVGTAQAQYERFRELSAQGFVAVSVLEQKRDDLLEQQGRLETARRNSLSLTRELGRMQGELATLPSQVRRDQSQLRRQAMELDQQSIVTETHKRFLVTAPQDGTVTGILADAGQMVSGQTMLTILPSNVALEVQLFVPSRAAGFIEAGQPVLIRYAAYPFQKFGQYRGIVQDVSRTSMSDTELPPQMGKLGDEGVYRVRVKLAQQHVMTYGHEQQLIAGMKVEADVMQDRRSLLEWVFEPLYSLNGHRS